MKNKRKFSFDFIVNNRSVTQHKELADQFNIFFSDIWLSLYASIKIDFTDYLNIPSAHRFNFNPITVICKIIFLQEKMKYLISYLIL